MPKMIRGRFHFAAADPMMVRPDKDCPACEPSAEQKRLISVVGRTIKAYLLAAHELIEGKLSHLKGIAPDHMRSPGQVLAIVCPNGICIRYERGDKLVVRAGWMEDDLSRVVQLLSQGVVYSTSDVVGSNVAPSAGVPISVVAINSTTNESQPLVSQNIVFNVTIERPPSAPKYGNKPYRALSLLNRLELRLLVEAVEDHVGGRKGDRALISTILRLPAGWECLDVFPYTNPKEWQPRFAPTWAENDLLSFVVARQYNESKLQSLDPRAEARKIFKKLLFEYRALLDLPPRREEELQQFLTAHPQLICPTQLRMWPKLQLGDKKTDFVFQDATNCYLLVELERSTDQVFTKGGDYSSKLTHAMGQVHDWRRYIEDNLHTVQVEQGLGGISANPDAMIVIGRRSDMSADDRRKLVTRSNSEPKLKIWTYDDIHDNAKAAFENLLGAFWETGPGTQVFYLENNGAVGSV